MINFELFTSPTCAPCNALKARINELEAVPAIRYVDTSTPEGYAEAKSRGIRQLPAGFMDNISVSNESFYEHVKYAA